MINITVEEAKQMRDLISKSSVIDRLSEEAKRLSLSEIAIHSAGQAVNYYTGVRMGMLKSAIIVSTEPTIEPKKGKWKLCKSSIHPYGNNVKCSECGFEMASSFGYNFCPNCGAKMDVADNDVGKMERSEE